MARCPTRLERKAAGNSDRLVCSAYSNCYQTNLVGRSVDSQCLEDSQLKKEEHFQEDRLGLGPLRDWQMSRKVIGQMFASSMGLETHWFASGPPDLS